MTNITRRTALRGATAAFAAVGLSSAQIPQTPASEFDSVPEALSDLMFEYRDAHLASRDAEKAFNNAREDVRRQIDAANIWVPYTGFGHKQAQLGSGYRCTYAGAARKQLENDRETYLAGCTTSEARKMVRRHFYRLRDKVEAGIAKADAIRDASSLAAVTDRDADARNRAYRAKDALFAYRPTTIDEVAAIVRCLYLTATESGSYIFPSACLAKMLNPDLAVAP